MTHDPTDPEAERALLERFRGGDGAAFDALVLMHRRAIYGVARRIVGSHEEADEITQETFVRALRALPGFRGEARLSTWLVRIAINVARSAVRAPRTLPLETAAHVADPGLRPDEALGVTARRRLRRAVAGLPPRQREAVALKVFSEMTYEDAAAAMGLTVGAVKAHLHQAVANLRRRLLAEEGSR